MKIPYAKLTLAAAISALSVHAVADSVRAARIIGGAEATPNTYPWIVSLQSNGGEHFCGGSLIDKRWVMTAAHCLEDEQASNIQVVVSEYDVQQADSGEEKRRVKRIISHPDYRDDHDIALLELAEPVEKAAIGLMSKTDVDNLSPGTQLAVMGWGNRATDGEDYPNKLHEVRVPLTEQDACKTSYASVGSDITENMICAGLTEGGKDSCQGDSGGPLVIQKDNAWLQVGIVSFGEGCAAPNFPGVYTRAANYERWIADAKASQPDDNADKPDQGQPDQGQPDLPAETLALGLPDLVVFEADHDDDTHRPVEHQLTLTNDTGAPLTITGLSVGDDGFFTLINRDCLDKNLAAGEQCQITLAFAIPEGTNLEDFRMHEDDWDENASTDDTADDYLEDDLTDDDDALVEDEMEDGVDGDEWFDEDDIEELLASQILIDGTLHIHTNRSDSELSEIRVQLLGITDAPEPAIDAPAYVEFFAMDDQAGVTEWLELTNISDQAVAIQGLSLNDNTHFSIVDNGCEAKVLEPDAHCSIELHYAASDVTPQTAELTISTSNKDQPDLTVELYGETLIALPDADDTAEDDLLDWYYHGQTPWGMSNAEAFELVTDLLNENSESLLMTEVEGPATLDFDFELNGDHASNHFYFIIDGEVIKTITGDLQQAVHHQAQLSPGKHKVQWVYRKANASESGAKARVSNVKVTPSATPASNSAAPVQTNANATGSTGGGSSGFWFLGLMAALLGIRKFRK